MNECKIVAVLNRKGGVCKTTTTHNLGVALVQRGYRVLLVDCDTQRNLSISLGLNRPDEECYTLCELLQPLIDVEVDEVDTSAGNASLLERAMSSSALMNPAQRSPMIKMPGPKPSLMLWWIRSEARDAAHPSFTFPVHRKSAKIFLSRDSTRRKTS